MNTFIEQARGGAGAPTKRRVLVLSYAALVLAVVVSAGAWRTLDRSERGAASVTMGTSDIAAPDIAPLHATEANSGRLTVYLVGSTAEAGAAYERIAAEEQIRAENWAPPLGASIVIAGSADEDRHAFERVTAVREGLGVPVEVIDLRAPAYGESSNCGTVTHGLVYFC